MGTMFALDLAYELVFPLMPLFFVFAKVREAVALRVDSGRKKPQRPLSSGASRVGHTVQLLAPGEKRDLCF